MHTIVGFLSFRDFINEIRQNAPVVRIQDYYLTATTDLGIEWTTHYVELGARQMSRSGSDEIYICRFRATGPDCECICGGANHGVGLRKAMDNTQKMAEEWIRRWIETHPGGKARVVPQQLSLFDLTEA